MSALQLIEAYECIRIVKKIIIKKKCQENSHTTNNELIIHLYRHHQNLLDMVLHADQRIPKEVISIHNIYYTINKYLPHI